MADSTANWTGVQKILRTRLLTFTPTGGGTTLATRLSTATGAGAAGKLYLNRAPDNLSGRWGIFRVIEAPITGMDGGFMIRATGEITFYGRPAGEEADNVESCMDVSIEAWRRYVYGEAGGVILTDTPTNRLTIPYEAPADRELHAVRALFPFRCTPKFLTRYAAT